MGILASSLSKYHLTSLQLESLSDLIRTRILSVSTPEIIYLFGSYSRGTVTGTSDLDIAIIFKNKEVMKEQKKVILNSKLFLDYSTDLLFYTYDEFEKRSMQWGVCEIIKKEGRVIYDKRSEV